MSLLYPNARDLKNGIYRKAVSIYSFLLLFFGMWMGMFLTIVGHPIHFTLLLTVLIVYMIIILPVLVLKGGI